LHRSCVAVAVDINVAHGHPPKSYFKSIDPDFRARGSSAARSTKPSRDLIKRCIYSPWADQCSGQHDGATAKTGNRPDGRNEAGVLDDTLYEGISCSRQCGSSPARTTRAPSADPAHVIASNEFTRAKLEGAEDGAFKKAGGDGGAACRSGPRPGGLRRRWRLWRSQLSCLWRLPRRWVL
jgi:hypothetical protein